MRAYWRVDRWGELLNRLGNKYWTSGEFSAIDPWEKGVSGLLRDFELNRPTPFSLHHDRSVEDAASLRDVFHSKANQVTAMQLTIDCKVEESKIAPVFG